MSIVNWGDQEGRIKISAGVESDQDLMMGILKMDARDQEKRWKGSIVHRKASNKGTATVEIKKMIDYSNVKIVIGSKSSFGAPSAKCRDICISANGKMQFLADELQEMNLAILEAQNVLHNFRDKGWIE